MRHRIFRHSKHLQNVAPKRALHVIQINLANVVAHNLLRGIVDQHMQRAKFLHVLLDGLAARFIVHEIARNKEALLSFLFDHFLGLAGVFLFFGEVDDCDVGAFAGEEDGDGAAYAGAGDC
jgi:hypothetical protein